VIIFLSVFLFWRAGRHELVESESLFDSILVSSIGAFFFGRIFDFLIRADLYRWSVKRLIFFNIYSEFNFYGALLGAILTGAIFLRAKKINPWQIFDLGAAPLVFTQSLAALVIFMTSQIQTRGSLSLPIFPLAFYYFVAYLVIFWILKRFETKKRHVGFFACFYLVSVPLVDLSLSLTSNRQMPTGSEFWRLLIGLGLLIFGIVCWYILAKRKLTVDLKSILGLVLLGIFRTRRMIISVEEAGKFSKTLLFLPLYLLRSLYFIVKLVCSQAVLGLAEFLKAFKGRK